MVTLQPSNDPVPATAAPCRNCNAERATPDANFCVQCGYPLAQPCPYGCGAEWVPLGATDEPTSECPRCARPFHSCAGCGRLYTTATVACQTAKCQGARVKPARAAWGGLGGSAQRSYSAEVATPWRGGRPRLILSESLEQPEVPLVAVAFTGRYIVCARADRLVALELTGRPGPVVPLGRSAPADEWRFVASHARAFCAHESEVSVFDLPTLTRLRSFSGTFVDQVLTTKRWFGLRHEQASTTIEERDHDGELRSNCTAVQAGFRPTVFAAEGETAFVGFENGALYRYRAGTAEPLGAGEPGTHVKALAIASNDLICVDRFQGGDRVRRVSETGAVRWRVLISDSELSERLCVVGNLVVVASRTKGRLEVLGLEDGRSCETRQIPGATEILGLVGAQQPSGAKLVVAARVSEKPQVSLTDLFDEGCGATWSIVECLKGAALQLMIAAGRIVVATHADWESLIQVYDPT